MKRSHIKQTKVPLALKRKKIPVTRRALVQRLQRTLKKQGAFIDDTRDGVAVVVQERGKQWYSATHDLEKLARDLGVLRKWEIIAERK